MATIINNIPEYAYKHEYIVFRSDKNADNWFYGAYDGFGRAAEVAAEVGGMFVLTVNAMDAKSVKTAEDEDDWAFTAEDYDTGNAPCDDGRGCIGTQCRHYEKCH